MGRIDDALRRTNRDVGRGTGAEASPPASAPWDFRPGEGPDALAPTGAGRESAETERETATGPAAHAPRVAEPVLEEDGRLARFRGFDPATSERLVVSDTGSPVLLEQFRSLAATLQQAQQEQQVKSVIVTSASPGDGKSFVAINLALTLSESYHRNVLLIDADLRRPSLHQMFKLPSTGGLAAGLKSKGDLKIALVQISDTLTLLPGGRPEPNPLGGLSSDRMKRIVEEATSRFDWVIVDTPPVGVLADGRVVSNMVDAAILVVRAGVTQFTDVQAAVETLDRERILGVVLNGAAPTDMQGEGYYRHYYGRDLGDVEEDSSDK